MENKKLTCKHCGQPVETKKSKKFPIEINYCGNCNQSNIRELPKVVQTKEKKVS